MFCCFKKIKIKVKMFFNLFFLAFFFDGLDEVGMEEEERDDEQEDGDRIDRDDDDEDDEEDGMHLDFHFPLFVYELLDFAFLGLDCWIL